MHGAMVCCVRIHIACAFHVASGMCPARVRPARPECLVRLDAACASGRRFFFLMNLSNWVKKLRHELDTNYNKKWGFIDAAKMQVNCQVSQNPAVYVNTWLTCSFLNDLFFKSWYLRSIPI